MLNIMIIAFVSIRAIIRVHEPELLVPVAPRTDPVKATALWTYKARTLAKHVIHIGLRSSVAEEERADDEIGFWKGQLVW